ncbi:MAG: serine/threonine-protein kinase, partial [Rubripirellula sp.]
MTGELNTAGPALDNATRSFVRRALAAGLVEIDDLKKVVVSLMSESHQFTPERLADGLVGASILTAWQANKLLAGKSNGFYLGSYRLLRPLGKGGMGVVYLGEHNVMKRLMALKILPPEATRDKRRIERFKAEARACAQLDHPNIVRAYDFAEAGSKLYIVMEYVDGIDLHLAVQRDGLMSIADVLDALTQSTHGLAHAHERGIVHRDIKPSNLLLRTDGVVKLSDLGLARIGVGESGEEEKRRLMGTADFISPEQALNSKTVDARADIYSLGCTTYYLLTGQAPFAGTAAQRLAKHQTMPMPDVRLLREDCPDAFADLIARMAAKRPDDRPNSAVELLTQLKRMGAPVSDEPRTRRVVAPAGDTVVDDATYQATLDD